MPRLHFEEREMNLPEGATLIAALGPDFTTRTALDGRPRGPLCGMGECFECRVKIDGREVLACMTPAEDGMDVRRA
ncbi:MAG TPA: (2Fe-2S)-binding protein [Holophagaceae bacterium]|jgi:aerobic-type carbon monoxide dehydrogenase small subunit (CoxS/CutS family)|nr:(2Fe-2S)-binding protein [Holophagaceae bacterium]